MVLHNHIPVRFDLPGSRQRPPSGPHAERSPRERASRAQRASGRATPTPRGSNPDFVAGLYQRLIDTASGQTQEQTFRVYAGGGQVAEIVRKNGTDKTLFFHPDHEGTVDTISTDTGDHFRQQFDAFGAPVDDALDPELTRAGFTGHQHDRDLDLIDMGGRVYDQLAAQFMTADPIMQAPFWSQGLNRYAYAFNDPVNNVDPSGFDVSDYTGPAVLGGIGAGVIGYGALAASGNAGEVGWDLGIGSWAAGPGMSTGEAFGSGGPAGGAGAATTVWLDSISIAKSGMRGWPGYAGAAHTGYSYPGTAPSTAQGTTSGTQGGQHALAQNQGGPTSGSVGPHDTLDHTPVFCGEAGAPTCGPSPKVLTELDRFAWDFVRRHARVAQKLKNELGTVIYRTPGGRLQQSGSEELADASIGTPLSVHLNFPPGSKAMVHLHALEFTPPTFSASDIKLAREWGLPSYLSVNRGQSILRFDPATNSIVKLPGVWGQNLPTGGAIP